ncbi:MAG: hypothetical protein WCZ00_00970 [Acholeplasmataceae bacterium]
MKKFLMFFIEPFKIISNRNVSEKITNYFNKRPILCALVSFIITLIIVFFMYAKPYYGW